MGRDLGRAWGRGLSDADLGTCKGGDDFGAGGLGGRSVVRASRRLLVTDGVKGGDVLVSLLGKLAVNLRNNVPRIGVTSEGQGR